MSFSHALRWELADRAMRYAQAQSLPHRLSYGEQPVVCFESVDEYLHGNFLPAAYKAIAANPEWSRRLKKVHTGARRCLPVREQGRWRELDSCVSSDALLMNVFCYPKLLTQPRVASLLNVEPGCKPSFGVPAHVPLTNQRCDRTEIDMRLGHLLVEAKLTEGGFQSADRRMVERYRDFPEVFDHQRLPQNGRRFHSYQLIRNVLAAHTVRCSFCVLLDARRPDLIDAVYAVLTCVRPVELRTSCAVLTWQELARVLPASLRTFLADKYGVGLSKGIYCREAQIR